MLQTFDDQASPRNGVEHLPLIREALAARGLDAFLIPHEDEHQNEYLPAANERLAWATGFTGSAGAAVVRRDSAVLFVDGRYTLQARTQVDPEVLQLRDVADGGLATYLSAELAPGETVGYDPKLHSPDALDRLRTAVGRANAHLAPVADNPVDAAWRARPVQPCASARPHVLELAGEASIDKRRRVGAAVAAVGAETALITAPSSVAWLFNIRGGDVQRTPVTLAQALLHGDGSAVLFIDAAKTSPQLIDWLGNEVRTEAPATLEAELQALKEFRLVFRRAHRRRRRGRPGSGSLHRAARRQERGGARRRETRPRTRRRGARSPSALAGDRGADLAAR